MITFGSLFAGIGGFDLGFELAGMTCKWQVEIDPYCQRVLAKNWPSTPRWDDICTFPPTEGDWSVDVICGGFPCQDISYAGKGVGIHGERSGLFFELARVVREVGPRIVVLENVAALLTRGMGEVLGTLASLGFDAEWHCIPAAAVGAPHIRDRVFVLGVANCDRWQQRKQASEAARYRNTAEPTGCHAGAISNGSGNGRREGKQDSARSGEGVSERKEYRPGNVCGDVADTDSEGLSDHQRQRAATWASRRSKSLARGWWDTEPSVGRGFDGFSRKLDGGLINGDAAKDYARQAVSVLREIIQPQEIQQCLGGLNGVSETQILLAVLCEYSEVEEHRWLEMERKEASQRLLRSVWRHVESARSPLQSRRYGQQAREFTDALRELSHETPSQFPKAWKNGQWEDGIPRVTNGIPKRVDRLKGLGNAIVPQVAEQVGLMVMDYFTEAHQPSTPNS